MSKRIAKGFLIFITCILVFNFFRTILRLSQRGDLLKNASIRLDEAKEEKDLLTRKLAQAKSSEFVEKQARERLNAAKPGEITVLLPFSSPTPFVSPTPILHLSNWQKWVEVYF